MEENIQQFIQKNQKYSMESHNYWSSVLIKQMIKGISAIEYN